MRLKAEEQLRELDMINGARAFDTHDFVDPGGGKHRWQAMQRMLQLSNALSPEEMKSLHRDWLMWDKCNLSDSVKWPSAVAYAAQYRKWIHQLLASHNAGKGIEIATWWRSQCRLKVVAPVMMLPPLSTSSSSGWCGPAAPR